MTLTRATLAPLMFATPAAAHDGDHLHMASVGALRHLLSQPDHLAILGLAVALAAWPVTRLLLKRVRK